MVSGYDYHAFQILFVDDEPLARENFADLFADEFRILTAATADEAWRVMERHGDSIAVLISDQRMPGQPGVELLGRVRTRYPQVVRILTTAYSDLPSAVDAVNKGGAYRYLTKPWNLEELKGAILRGLEFFLVRRDRDRLLGEKLHVLQRLIVMDRVRGLAALAAAFRCRLRYPMAAFKAYIRQAPLLHWKTINMGDAPHQDLATLARTEGENLIGAVQEVLWATLPRGVEEWDPRLDGYHADVDIEQILCQVSERMRLESGVSHLGYQVDVVPPVPRIKGNVDLLSRLVELLFERIQSLTRPDGHVAVHVTCVPAAAPRQTITLRFHGDGPAWSADDRGLLFSAVIPQASWTTGMDRDLLPAFFLAHHHGGTIVVRPDGTPGPGFEVRLAVDPEPLSDEALDAAWFDEVFSVLEQWDEDPLGY